MIWISARPSLRPHPNEQPVLFLEGHATSAHGMALKHPFLARNRESNLD